MNVVLAAEAEGDLIRIADHIAADSPANAVTFLNELRASCDDLAATPYAFPIVPRYERFGVRRRLFGAHLILYCVRGEQIEILHIRHSRRDLDAWLFPVRP